MVLPDNIEAVRTRLASRTSFFGGAISTRDNARVTSWKDLPSVKAAATGRSSAWATTCPTPPRPKLTTAVAEAAATTCKANGNGKKKRQPRNTSKAIKTTTTTAGTAAVASVFVQGTPPETLKESTLTLNCANKTKPATPARCSAVLTKTAPPDSKKTMLRHQQMTSLGVQTIQLLCMPTHKQATAVKHKQQQNQVPNSTEYAKSNEQELPLPVQKEAAITTTKPFANPRRHGRHAATPAEIVAKPKIKQRLKGTFYGSAQPPAARHCIRTVDDESDSDLDSFIETDEEDEEDEESESGVEEENKVEGEFKGQAAVGNADNIINKDSTDQEHVYTAHGDLYLSTRLNAKRNKPKKWKMALKEALNGYDASKFADVDGKPDRRMHSSYEEILAEEARAGKIAREIDRIEAEKEIATRAAEKENQQKKRRQQLVLLDDDTSSRSDHDSDGDDVLSDSSDEEEDGGVENRVRKKRKKLAGFLASF
ncbi:hypothetical protein KSW81_001098 [Nannochloris sp. 'desiccata']|nr:hypothetical protein KSW81_001098 [Chlorella desiccata (nom. nud.)]